MDINEYKQNYINKQTLIFFNLKDFFLIKMTLYQISDYKLSTLPNKYITRIDSYNNVQIYFGNNIYDISPDNPLIISNLNKNNNFNILRKATQGSLEPLPDNAIDIEHIDFYVSKNAKLKFTDINGISTNINESE